MSLLLQDKPFELQLILEEGILLPKYPKSSWPVLRIQREGWIKWLTLFFFLKKKT